MSQRSIEEQLEELQPSPSARFHRRMARASWTKTAVNRRRAFAGLTLTLMLAAALLVFTPQGNAWAREVLRFFTHAGSDTLPLQAFQLTPLPETATQDPGYLFNLSVSEVGTLAGFTVLQPAFLPEILVFDGASYDPGQNITRLFYRNSLAEAETTNGLVLRQEPFQTADDCELCGLVGASAEVETLTIGAASGEYVVGVWKLTDSGPVWESDPWLQTLRWQLDGMAFELVYMGNPEEITKADLTAIAESIK
jgi:hypothetical protein